MSVVMLKTRPPATIEQGRGLRGRREVGQLAGIIQTPENV